MTLTTTRWNSPAILTCSSPRRDARSCRWGHRLKCEVAGPTRHLHRTPAPELPGRGHVSCPRSWADCRWRLSPARVALLLVGLPQPLWPPASRRIANSRRNAPCAIPVYWSNGLPWQHLCATGTVLGLVHSSYFQWRQHCKQPGAIRSQRTSVFTLEHWLEASGSSTPRWSGPTLKCQTCIETNPVENSFCPLIVSLSAGPGTRFILIEGCTHILHLSVCWLC